MDSPTFFQRGLASLLEITTIFSSREAQKLGFTSISLIGPFGSEASMCHWVLSH